MRDIANKSDGDEYLPEEFNSFYDESKNVIVTSDQTLSEADSFQLSKGISNYVGVGNFYIQTGSANAYILSPISPFKAPYQLFDGLVIRTKIVNTNTGASTLNWNGTGAKQIKKNRGIDNLSSGDLVEGDYPIFIYEQSGDIWHLLTEPIESNYILGYLRGFIFEQDTGDIAHDIKIFEGAARSENDLADMKIQSGSSLIKQIDANWAEGTNQGGFPSGLTLTANTFYHVFVISKSNGFTDAGFDSDTNASNLLADATAYNDYKHIGWIKTDSSENITNFKMFIKSGGERIVYYNKTIEDVSESPAITPVNKTVSAPPETLAKLGFFLTDPGSFNLVVQAYPTFVVPFSVDSNLLRVPNEVFMLTDHNRQIRYNRWSTAGTLFKLFTYGWME